jgi:superfamily II DNA or RNA helicase
MPYFPDHYDKLRFPIAQNGHVGLRPAQLAAAHALSAHFFGRSEAAIVVMPTGSGKTCVMLLAAFLLRATRALVITPSRMVRDQIGAAFETLNLLKSLGAIDNGAPCPKVAVVDGRLSDTSAWEALRDADVVVSTVQSSSPGVSGVALPPTDLFDFICCDEAHHTPAPSWRELLDHFKGARHAFFTATPFRRDAKALRGQVVFEYSLARAREDAVFGRLQYEPVEPTGGQDPDLALAKAVEAKYLSDRAAGLNHRLMVRTAQRTRADALAALYEKNTVLRLRTILGSHSPTRLRSALREMDEDKLDGLICVDMLGEGFDFPTLKIAALHSPHSSLAVTLQFIGRFARTTAPQTGPATFFAIPTEIETEAKRLYVVGAEWNEIVEEASRTRITSEREAREVLATFAPPTFAADVTSSTADAELDLSIIAPYFHVKVIEAPDGVNLDEQFEIPIEGQPLILRKSDEHHALVCVTRHVGQCRWSREDQLSDVHHELFILFFDEPSKLLFICSSRREVPVYDAIVEAVVKGTSRRLSPDEVNRVLRGLGQASFFSIGMRNRSAFGNAESYRMITGKSADKAVQKSDGRFYDRGHCFGRGKENGKDVTIGFSSASKVWANQRGTLPEFFAWCRKLAAKLVSDGAVSTSSGLDHLPLGKHVRQFPPYLVAGDWHPYFYQRDSLRLRFSDTEEFPLLDFGIRVVSTEPTQAVFAIEGHERSLEFVYRLDRLRPFSRTPSSGEVRVSDAEGRVEGPLVDYLCEYPPAFFTADLSRLEGHSLSTGTSAEHVFALDAIEAIDWTTAGIDPLVEKPNGIPTGRSIFEWLESRLVASAATVVFNDDGAGEVADFVALRESANGSTAVDMYHCKAASTLPVPGGRVEDLYEVTGQAIKSLRLTEARPMREHLLRRIKSTKQGLGRLVRGTEADIRSLLRDGVVATFTMTIVQPGIGLSLQAAQSSLLAAANSYVIGAQVQPLRIIGAR